MGNRWVMRLDRGRQTSGQILGTHRTSIPSPSPTSPDFLTGCKEKLAPEKLGVRTVQQIMGR